MNTAHAELPNQTEFWKSYWLHPRKTLRQVLATEPGSFDQWLMFAFGVVRSLSKAAERGMGDRVGLAIILPLAVIVGPLGARVWFFLASWAVQITGKGLGGTATREPIRRAMVWSCLPLLVMLPLWLLNLNVAGLAYFQRSGIHEDTSEWLRGWEVFFGGLEGVAWLWFVVLNVAGLAEVQGFSIRKTILNLLLPGLILLGVTAVVALVARGLSL